MPKTVVRYFPDGNQANYINANHPWPAWDSDYYYWFPGDVLDSSDTDKKVKNLVKTKIRYFFTQMIKHFKERHMMTCESKSYPYVLKIFCYFREKSLHMAVRSTMEDHMKSTASAKVENETIDLLDTDSDE